jgi:hypothetical protein
MHFIYSAIFKDGIFPKINKIKLVFCECAMVLVKHFVAGEVNQWKLYVTDGNIMYLTDASGFLISCVIQHYAPVVGWGRMEEQMHNVDYDPGP